MIESHLAIYVATKERATPPSGYSASQAVVTPNRLQIGFHPGNQSRSRKAHGDQPVGIEFEVDDVDALYEKLRKLGVKFLEKPMNAWGEREARFLDPDGYRLAISGPVGNHLV